MKNNVITTIRNHPVMLKRPYVKQFIKFCIIGTINTIIDFTIYFSLTRLVDFFANHILVANAIAFGTAVIFSYIMNKNWTFRDKNKAVKIQFSKFATVSIGGLIITEFILLLLVWYFEFSDIVAKITAVVIVLFWNFTINKLWTFAPEKVAVGEVTKD